MNDGKGRAPAAERLLAALVEAREAFDGAGLESEPDAFQALAALRQALRWSAAVALRREVAAIDPGAPTGLRHVVH